MAPPTKKERGFMDTLLQHDRLLLRWRDGLLSFGFLQPIDERSGLFGRFVLEVKPA
jgi:hypothetical protein